MTNNKSLHITKAKRSDAAGIVRYCNFVGGESDNLLFGADEFYLSVEDEERFIDSLGDSGTSALFVGRVDGEIVCLGSVLASGRARIAHQADVAISVRREFWNCGFGTKLLERMIGFARGNGKTEILHLGVRSDNVYAYRLYRKMGFVEIGRYDRYFKIDGEYFDEILMNLYL